MKGTYILVIRLLENSKILIGSLGIIDFIKGFYLYIGSAMGIKSSATLENRIKRHISESNSKNLFWHIDYLLASKICLLTRIYLIPTTIRLECIISKEIHKASDNYIKKFGSSDCRCPSHLYYFLEFDRIEGCFN
jgi:Uri superfamily endonuclease